MKKKRVKLKIENRAKQKISNNICISLKLKILWFLTSPTVNSAMDVAFEDATQSRKQDINS